MGLPVLILGESGSGKTYSLKNFEPNEISDINETAILALEKVNSTEGMMIATVLKQNRLKINELVSQIRPEEKTA